jgi:hypothetical protein
MEASGCPWTECQGLVSPSLQLAMRMRQKEKKIKLQEK